MTAGGLLFRTTHRLGSALSMYCLYLWGGFAKYSMSYIDCGIGDEDIKFSNLCTENRTHIEEVSSKSVIQKTTMFSINRTSLRPDKLFDLFNLIQPCHLLAKHQFGGIYLTAEQWYSLSASIYLLSQWGLSNRA